MKHKIIGFNWKLNPLNKKEAEKLARYSDYKHVIVFPPFVFLDLVGSILKKAQLGAQDVFWERKGAFTGEISPLMLKHLKVRYVLVGHSERRKYFGETNEMLRKKVAALIEAGLTPLFCIGEDQGLKRQGIEKVKSFIKNNILDVFSGLVGVKKLIIAYEPTWAIGKGKSDDVKRSEKIIGFIKDLMYKIYGKEHIFVIYGGSVSSSNIYRFLSSDLIDGVLVGGASVHPKEVVKMIKIYEKLC